MLYQEKGIHLIFMVFKMKILSNKTIINEVGFDRVPAQKTLLKTRLA